MCSEARPLLKLSEEGFLTQSFSPGILGCQLISRLETGMLRGSLYAPADPALSELAPVHFLPLLWLLAGQVHLHGIPRVLQHTPERDQRERLRRMVVRWYLHPVSSLPRISPAQLTDATSSKRALMLPMKSSSSSPTSSAFATGIGTEKLYLSLHRALGALSL